MSYNTHAVKLISWKDSYIYENTSKVAK